MAGRSATLFVCRMYTIAPATPIWFAVSLSVRPGETTRPVSFVGPLPALHVGTAEQSSQLAPLPATHRVGPSIPPMQTCPSAHVRPSLAQFVMLPHESTV